MLSPSGSPAPKKQKGADGAAFPQRSLTYGGSSSSSSTHISSKNSSRSEPQANSDTFDARKIRVDTYEQLSPFGSFNPLRPNEPTEAELEKHLSTTSTCRGWCLRCGECHTWNTAEALILYEECIVPPNVLELGPNIKCTKEWRSYLRQNNHEDNETLDDLIMIDDWFDSGTYGAFARRIKENVWGLAGHDSDFGQYLVLKDTQNLYETELVRNHGREDVGRVPITASCIDNDQHRLDFADKITQLSFVERLKGDMIILIANEIERLVKEKISEGKRYTSMVLDVDNFFENTMLKSGFYDILIKCPGFPMSEMKVAKAIWICPVGFDLWHKGFSGGMRKEVAKHIRNITNGFIMSIDFPRDDIQRWKEVLSDTGACAVDPNCFVLRPQPVDTYLCRADNRWWKHNCVLHVTWNAE